MNPHSPPSQHTKPLERLCGEKEVLGHGTSDNSDFNANSMDALHMSNIYLSAQGSSLYRNGSDHDYEGESINIGKSNAYDVPNVYVPDYLGAALLQPLAIMTNF